MPRTRLHAVDTVLGAAEELLLERGRSGVTSRALAERAGVPNGSIYHEFGSVETVVARAWLRRARQFLALQQEALTAGDGRRAVLAAADAPASLAGQDPVAAQLLVGLTRDDVLTDAVAEPVALELRSLDAALAGTLRTLARALWDRGDAAAVDVVTTCVVRLPAALLFPGIRAGRVPPLARAHLAAAVGAVLDCGPPGRALSRRSP